MSEEVDHHEEEEEGGGGGFPRWIIYILILGVVNLLSWIFDWPFWIY